MERDQAIQRVRKCFALGKSPNSHEAAAAMRQAQKLMERHGISEADVALSVVSEVNRPSAMTGPRWEVRLANMIAEAFGCVVLWIVRDRLLGSGWRRVHTVSFIGVGPAPEIAGYAWDVLDRQCSKQRLAHIRAQPKNCKPITRTARGDAFADGWVSGIREKLATFAGERHPVLLQQFMDLHHPSAASTKAPPSRAIGRNVRDDSTLAGFVSGQQGRLDRAVSGSSRELLGQ